MSRVPARTAGTSILDFVEASGSLEPSSVVTLGGKLYFTGFTSAGGGELALRRHGRRHDNGPRPP